MIILASSILILILDLIEQFIGEIYKSSQKKCLKIYFFKHSLICLFLILLINSNKRINYYKNGLDISRGTDTSDFMSLKVFNGLHSCEKL